MSAGAAAQPRLGLRPGILGRLGQLLLRAARLRIPQRLHKESSCWASFLFHLALMVLLGLMNGVAEHGRGGTFVDLESLVAVEDQLLALDDPLVPLTGSQDDGADPLAGAFSLTPNPLAPDTPGPVVVNLSPVAALISPEVAGGQTAGAESPAAPTAISEGVNDPLRPSGRPTGGGLEGRGKDLRGRMALANGGSPASEDAVARGLAWLAAHQRDDGSWHFDHQNSVCKGLCGNPGTVGTTTGATGLALLAFLGAGEVHADSQYKAVVDKGLYYLVTRLLRTPLGGDLQEGTMYAQGIAAVALCEAYAMTGDASLRTPAQLAVEFIGNAQHSEGGWRYAPGQPGDTTVFGWQLMALKSARLSDLEVPPAVFERASGFLDRVQTGKGAYYGYMTPDKKPAPTAIGLLSRMYLGWYRYDPRLAEGVRYLEKLGPSPTDMYFDYYATQVLFHYQGRGWNTWNRKLREHLIATQSRQGHEHGSWFFPDEHGQKGGRLYTTAMSVMILEVYYRHMPLYGSRAVDDNVRPVRPIASRPGEKARSREDQRRLEE